MPRTTILVLIDGSFNYPSTKISTRFLYYLSVYGNLSKNSFFYAFREGFSRLAGAKVRLIFHPTKYFGNIFSFFGQKNYPLDANQEDNSLYLI